MARLSSGLRVRRTTNYLSLAERRWDVLLTMDRKSQYQQQVIGRKGSWFSARRRTDYRISYFANLRATLLSIRRGQVVEVAMF